MNLDEAIGLNFSLVNGTYDLRTKELEDALMLGIEALQRVKDMRVSPCTTADELLSGETDA